MKLYHITKQGTLHFQLKNGRLAAVYPDTGYVRVSHNLDGEEKRFRVGMLNRFDKAVALKNPGNITMWPINKRIKTKTMMPVRMKLYYKTPWNNDTDRIFEYPNKVFYEMESSKCELYPNDIEALMDLLTEFEAKNC